MSGLTAARRRTLAKFGRTMTIKRAGEPVTVPPPYVTATIRGYLTKFHPEDTTGEVLQGDGLIALMAEDLAGWDDGVPGQHDLVDDAGETWAVVKASKVFDGDALIGFNLHVRGGEY